MGPFQKLHRSLFFLMCLCMPATIGLFFTSSMVMMSLCGAIQLMTWSYLLYKTTLVKSGHIMVIVDNISGKASFGLDEGMYLLSCIYPTEETETNSCTNLSGDNIFHRGHICLAHVPQNAQNIMVVAFNGKQHYLMQGLHILEVPSATNNKLTYAQIPLTEDNEPIKQFFANHGGQHHDQHNPIANQAYLLRKDGLCQTYFVRDRQLNSLIRIEHTRVMEGSRYDHVASLPPATRILTFTVSLPIEVNNTDYTLDVECGCTIDKPKALIPKLLENAGEPLTGHNLQTRLTYALQGEMNGMVKAVFPKPADSKDKAFDEISASIREKAPNVVVDILKKWGVKAGTSDEKSPPIQVRLKHTNSDNEQRRLAANSSELDRVCAIQEAKTAEIVANMEAKKIEKAAQAKAKAITLVAQAKAKALELELKATQGFFQNLVAAFKEEAPDISPDQTMRLAVQFLNQRILGKAIANSGIQSIGSNVLGNLGFNVAPCSPNGKARPSTTDEKSPTMGHSTAGT